MLAQYELQPPYLPESTQFITDKQVRKIYEQQKEEETFEDLIAELETQFRQKSNSGEKRSGPKGKQKKKP